MVRALGTGGGGGGVALFHFKAGNMQKEIIGAASSKRESCCLAACLGGVISLFTCEFAPELEVDFIPNKEKRK